MRNLIHHRKHCQKLSNSQNPEQDIVLVFCPAHILYSCYINIIDYMHGHITKLILALIKNLASTMKVN